MPQHVVDWTIMLPECRVRHAAPYAVIAMTASYAGREVQAPASADALLSRLPVCRRDMRQPCFPWWEASAGASHCRCLDLRVTRVQDSLPHLLSW